MASTAIASLMLQKQFRKLSQDPVYGFSVGLFDESDIFEWRVIIIGPPDSLYHDGIFSAKITFPKDFPYNPPSIQFTSNVWHPNVYPDGTVCISILHPPGEDPYGYMTSMERWNPVYPVESIYLCIISMLSSPDYDSPANVDAAIMWRESKDEFRKTVSRCVTESQGLV